MAVSGPRCASITWGWLYGLMPESKEHFGLGRHWMRGGVSSVLLALGALQPNVGRQPLAFAIAIGLAGFAAWLARGWADPRLLDAAILIGLIWAIGVIPVVGVWPIGPGLALALAALLAWRQARLPGWRDWLRVGEVDTVAWLLCGLTALVSVVGLLAWQRLFSGTLPADYAYAARSVPVWAAGLGGLGFLIINGVVEDMVFFGVLLTAATSNLGRTAIPLAALAFGVAHLNGVPSGVVGAVMAGCWGLILAYLRHRTGGMLATYLAHLVADTTIIAVLLPLALTG